MTNEQDVLDVVRWWIAPGQCHLVSLQARKPIPPRTATKLATSAMASFWTVLSSEKFAGGFKRLHIVPCKDADMLVATIVSILTRPKLAVRVRGEETNTAQVPSSEST